jgi:DNA-directed RNA polymerase specialized sigma24 family protein
MSMAQTNSREHPSSGPYATVADFEQIFMQDMSGLYLLAFLLAGSRDGAEKCFVNGVTESVRGYRVFKEWARSWARRTIILSAIRLFQPRRSSESAKPDPATARTIDKLPLESQMEVSGILQLPSFERFVFVMSALERYSDRECSILLGCAPREVTAARTRALQQLGTLMILREDEPPTQRENSAAYESPAPGIKLTIARYFVGSTGNGVLSHDAPLWPYK